MPIAPRILLTVAFLVLAAAAPAGAAFGPVGSLNQLGGSDGCVDDAGSSPCRDVRAMSGAVRLGVSPDGSVVLVPSPGGDSVAVLRRDALTGIVSQSGSTAGCVAPDGNAMGCRPAPNLDGATDAAFSPDGRHVYLAGANGIAAFEFKPDPEIGGLVPLSGAKACFSNTDAAAPGAEDNRCENGRALSSLTAITVSPDGASVYATIDAAVDENDGVVVLRRDAATGNLSQEDGAKGCVTVDKTASGDGDLPAPGSTPKGCGGELRAADGPTDVKVTRDGATLYLATRQGVAVLRRRADGTLAQPDTEAGCAVDVPQPRCADERALGEPHSLALSGDGASLYVSNQGLKELAHFRVGHDGALAQPKDESGCVADPPAPSDGTLPCATARSLGGSAPGIGVSPDGATVAVGGSDAIGEVALLDRNGSGGLGQAADPRGCLSRTGAATGTGGGAGRCLTGHGAGGTDFAWSAGAHHFYAAGGQSLAFLRREVAPACDDPSAATDSLTPVTVAFACSDLNGDAVSLEVVGPPAQGSTDAPTPDARVTYTPRADAQGLDTFLVRPRDGSGNAGRLSTATISITFKPGPPPPPPPPPPPTGRVPLPRAVTKVLRPDAKRRMRFSLECPQLAIVNCKGRLEILTARIRLTRRARARKVLVLALNYDLAPGQRRRFIVKASRKVMRVVRTRRKTPVTVILRAPAQGTLRAARNRGGADLKR